MQQNREEMEVLFTFLAERYERRTVMISSNLVFSKWDQIFKDPRTTMNWESGQAGIRYDRPNSLRNQANPRSLKP